MGIPLDGEHQRQAPRRRRASRTDVDVVAVASRDAARAEAYARERGIERAYGSYEELLDDPEVEAVYISLPNSMHVEWSIRALEAGKHVLCEKPLSRQPERGRAGLRRRRAGGPIADGGVHVPPQPADAAADGARRRAARSGACAWSAPSFSFPLATSPNVRLRPGARRRRRSMDVGCYCVSGARLLGGEPEQVYGEQVLASTGVDEVFTGTMRFPGDVLARVRLRPRAAGARRARGDRRGGLALPRRPLALPRSR